MVIKHVLWQGAAEINGGNEYKTVFVWGCLTVAATKRESVLLFTLSGRDCGKVLLFWKLTKYLGTILRLCYTANLFILIYFPLYTIVKVGIRKLLVFYGFIYLCIYFFLFCGKFFGANIPPKHGGNKGRSRSLSDARATLTVPVLLFTATSKVAPSTSTPSRSFQGWCEQASHCRSSLKSSATTHRSPGGILIGTDHIWSSRLCSVLFLFRVDLVSVCTCVCLHGQFQGVHGRPGVSAALLIARWVGCSSCIQRSCPDISEGVHLCSVKGSVAW